MERSLHRVSLGSRRARPDLSFYLTTFGGQQLPNVVVKPGLPGSHSKGQLRLSIDAHDRVLLLHKGKGLMSKEPGACDPYVKVCGGAGGGEWDIERPGYWAQSQGPSRPVGLVPFEEISLIPEDNRLRHQKTQTVPDCRDPAFYEHFFFQSWPGAWPLLTVRWSDWLRSPVQEEDDQKRLLVTVWNRASQSR
ncbi:hypothetical protein P7K49_001571 [Saguinus oedipus]|uniref:Uncharacterized protein n=1 Tax=Saguinus oedipus TaxID=9490 RepID=A0ABQ9WEV3_SAGOE|nr:hypothetical protein P7K49_001571 [Saguinus oedipus]